MKNPAYKFYQIVKKHEKDEKLVKLLCDVYALGIETNKLIKQLKPKKNGV